MKYEAAIFDLDGTLLESTSGHLEWMFAAVEEAIEESEKEVDVGEISHEDMKALAGIKGDEVFEEKCRELGVDPGKFRTSVSYHRARQKLQLLEEDLLHLVDGAGETLGELREMEISTALVSNAPDPSVDEVIRFFDLAKDLDFFRGVTGLEDFRHRKPDPYLLEIACEELDAGSCIYIGDSRVDVQAAEKMGIDSVLVGSEDPRATYSVEKLEEIPGIFRD